MASILSQLLPSLIGAAGGVGSALLNRFSNRETPIQESQRDLIDQILSSVKGSGPFSDLFNMDENAFQRSYVDPAKSLFNNQIAPAIQQNYIGGQYGQQRAGGTGLQDSLARAGIDLDQMLNQQYAQFRQGAQNRQLDALSRILGQGAGVLQPQGIGQTAAQGLAGYLSGSDFSKRIDSILGSDNQSYDQSDSLQDTFLPKRKGFENERAVYNPTTGVQQ